MGDDPWLRKLKAKVPVYYYGTSDRDDFQARNVKRDTKAAVLTRTSMMN